MFQPLVVFCCGCSVGFGVRFTLLIHSFVCMFYILTAISNVVLDYPTLGYDMSFSTQMFNLAFAIATVPFIIAGTSGVNNRIESHLRVYFGWLLFTLALDVLFIGLFIHRNVYCSSMPAFFTLYGRSFACGAQRITVTSLLVAYLVTMCYFLFVVWSLCEEIKMSSTDDVFTYLVGRAEDAELKKAYKAGLFGTGEESVLAIAASGYGAMAAVGYHSSIPIFGGTEHDVHFPPMHHRESG